MVHRLGSLSVPLLIVFSLLNSALAEWLNHGSDISNTRSSRDWHINASTAPSLRLKWTFFAGKDISATPAIANGVVYFPSWNGFLFAVNAFDGSLIWSQNLIDLARLQGVNTTVGSRATPTVAGNLLLVGIYGPAVVIAVSRSTGRMVWWKRLDPRPLAVITTSGTAYRGGFYVGVSSLEESLPAGQCCVFRGSLVKLDINLGNVLWQTYTVPDNEGKVGGYSGGAIWGSSPAVDSSRNLVYAATGNLYTAPDEVTKCQAAQNNQTTPTQPNLCIGKGVNFNSIIALDLATGHTKWATQLGGYDIWYFGCYLNRTNCPPGPNVDADFGEAPMLTTIWSNGKRRDVAVAVQKSGIAWALDRDNGDIVWFKAAGPGSEEGGGQWGAATDGRLIYTNIANSKRETFKLSPTNLTTTAGGWVGLDANTGEILWTTANPSNDTAQGPVTVVNNVVFAGSVALDGPIYAMNASNGNVIWSYNTGATVYGGISVSYGCIYLGNGYNVSLGTVHGWTAGTSLYSFCVW